MECFLCHQWVTYNRRDRVCDDCTKEILKDDPGAKDKSWIWPIIGELVQRIEVLEEKIKKIE